MMYNNSEGSGTAEQAGRMLQVVARQAWNSNKAGRKIAQNHVCYDVINAQLPVWISGKNVAL